MTAAKVLFTDTYTAIKGMFVIKRKVCVAAAGDSYTGFSTSYSVGESENAGVKNYEFFIPSVIYRDSEYMKSGSVMSRLTSGNYVKETRCGTPLAMLRNKKAALIFRLRISFPKSRQVRTFTVRALPFPTVRNTAQSATS